MPEDRSNRNDSEKSVAALLRGLSSPDPGPVWVAFLERYASLIMTVVRQFEYEQERTSDCFLYVCEHLNDDGFRRLLKFNTAGKARFRTWLSSVVFNLCVDWHRKEYGRATLLPAVSALPAFDRAVYRLFIEQGMDKERCFQSLRADFPDLTREIVAKAVMRIYSVLTPRQRWQICVRNHRKTGVRGGPFGDAIERLPDPAIGPEAEAERQQQLDAMERALSRLPAADRLLLRLRFQEGLTLKRIAQLQFRGDVNHAWRQVQAAVGSLSRLIESDVDSQTRKN